MTIEKPGLSCPANVCERQTLEKGLQLITWTKHHHVNL